MEQKAVLEPIKHLNIVFYEEGAEPMAILTRWAPGPVAPSILAQRLRAIERRDRQEAANP